MHEKPEQFNNKKRRYFIRLGLSVREALKLHKKVGLWERKDSKRDWGNVSEHCLAEAARVDVLADKLGLSDEIKRDLVVAAAVHDFFKKGEKEIVSTEGLTWDSFEKATEESTRQMREAGFSERIVRLANAVGHDSLKETETILKEEQLTQENTAYLVLHYVDDYAIGSDWADPAEMSSDCNKINSFDKRIDSNEANPRYARLNEGGREYFNGETTFEAQRRIGHLVEEKLTTLLSEKTGQIIDPKELPQLIDAEIKKEIENL